MAAGRYALVSVSSVTVHDALGHDSLPRQHGAVVLCHLRRCCWDRREGGHMRRQAHLQPSTSAHIAPEGRPGTTSVDLICARPDVGQILQSDPTQELANMGKGPNLTRMYANSMHTANMDQKATQNMLMKGGRDGQQAARMPLLSSICVPVLSWESVCEWHMIKSSLGKWQSMTSSHVDSIRTV